MRLLLSSLVLLAAAPSAAQTVGIAGSGLGCLFNDVSSAVSAAAPGETLYLIPGTVFYESVVVGKDLTIAAGNLTCTGPAAAGAAHPIIDGATVERPLEVQSSANVVLERVDLARGAATQGGNARVSSGSLQLVDVAVYLGVADDGGGLYVDAGASALLQGSTSVSWNVAGNFGGGAYVAGELDLWDGVVVGDVLVGNSAVYGGGLLVAEGGQATLFEGASVVGNDASMGGGVYTYGSFWMLGGRVGGPGGEANDNSGVVVAGGEIVMLAGEIAYNHAGSGGGITVIGQGSGLVSAGAKVHHNTADDAGGGIYLHEASSFSVSGEISDNEAGVRGGGIAVINVFGPFELLGADVLRNHSEDNGGGVALVSADPARIVSTWINGNSAVNRGGGLHIACCGMFAGTLEMSGPRDLQEGCEYRGPTAANQYCSELRDNTALEGGGLFAGSRADATIRETAFIRNTATAQGSALQLLAPTNGLPNRIDLKNVLVVRNKGLGMDVVRIEDGAELTAAHVTMTENEGTPLHYLATALGSFRRSIVWDVANVVIDSPLVLPAACTSFNGVTGGTSGSGRVFSWDPQLVTTARGRYRLSVAGSPNSVDKCSAGQASDLDSDPRPAGPLVLWDRGAFEAQ